MSRNLQLFFRSLQIRLKILLKTALYHPHYTISAIAYSAFPHLRRNPALDSSYLRPGRVLSELTSMITRLTTKGRMPRSADTLLGDVNAFFEIAFKICSLHFSDMPLRKALDILLLLELKLNVKEMNLYNHFTT